MSEAGDSSAALAQLRTIATQAPSPVTRESLRAFLAQQPELSGKQFEVILPEESIAAGASGGLLMFDIASPDGSAGVFAGRYVLRYELGDGSFFSQTSLPSQFQIMKAVHALGIPCAEVMWLDPDGKVANGATSVIMRRVDARAPVIQYVQAGAFVEATDQGRETMIRALMSTLVKIHSLPVAEINLDLLGERSGAGEGFLVAQVDWVLREMLARFPEDEGGPRAELHGTMRATMIETAARLRQATPKGVRPVLVHGDPTIANTMFDDEGQVAAILDWELAHAGLAAEDVFYFIYAMQSIASLGGVAVELPQIGDVSRYYVEAGGRLDHVEYASALSAFAITAWGCIGLRRMPEALWEAQRITWQTQSSYLAAAIAKLGNASGC